MGELYKVNFHTGRLLSKGGAPVGWRAGTKVGRGLGKADRFMVHNHGKFKAATVGAGAVIDYNHARHEGLTKKQSVGVTSIGVGTAAATHYATHRVGLGWKTGMAVDLATGLGAVHAQDRLIKHYQRHNSQHLPRMRPKVGRLAKVS